MIKRRNAGGSPSRWRRPSRHTLIFFTVLLALAVVAVSPWVWRARGDASVEQPTTPAAASASPLPSATGTPSVAPTEALTPDPADIVQLPGVVPERGQGTFGYEMSPGRVHGRGGELRRYRVAVEKGSGEETTAFAAEVERALGNPNGWTASGRLRLARVPAGAGYDFTIYLATAGTAERMCAAGYVDIRVGGRPYTSCRTPGKVIINLDRWRLSVPHFVAGRVPLATYRLYVINHELGHELGHGHERCPGRGRPAPVMMQQSLFLNGCVANPWPYLNGRRYAGRPA